MNRLGRCFLALALLSVVACQQDNREVSKKLDQINQRLVAIEAKLGGAAPGAGAGAGAARPQPQQRAAPNPTAIYAVPIGESAAIGSKIAKVTIVEAFTFT